MEMMEIKNPATGELIEAVPKATADDVDRAMERAYGARKLWAETPLHTRCDLLKNFSKLVKENAESLAKTLCADNGKTIRQARAEIANIEIAVDAFTETAKHLHGTVISDGNEPNYDAHVQTVTREPLGVVVCIIPFNFPSNMFCQKVIPALVMGNTAVVLPPSGNPLTVLRLTKLMHEAGIPEDVLVTVTAPGALKEVAVTDKRAAHVTLTGSTEIGTRVYELAAKNLIPCTLELGGNDPFIVMDDADVDLAVSELLVGRMANAGQVCCASKRFIVHSSRVEEFTKKSVDFLKKLTVGDPTNENTDVGCLINERAAMTVEEQVNATVAAGAKIECGGKRNGAFYEPTVLSGVTKEMPIAQNLEVFGPVVPVISFHTEDEAIEIANNTIYGLSGAIFTNDYKRILRMTKALDTGTVVVNGAGNLRSFEMPFGGHKKSGIGTEGALTTLYELSQTKVMILKYAN